MNPTSILSPEIVDLGLAVGLLRSSGGSVEFDSDWFSDPGPRVRKALADDARREALVRFVDTVNGPGDATRTGGVTLVKIFSARDLGIAGAPDLVVNVSLDDAASTYVEVGLAVSFATVGPETHTDLVVPLYRTGKLVGAGPNVHPVAEHFALAAGAPIRLQTTIDLGDGAPDASGFGLRRVAAVVGVPVTGAAPSMEVHLEGLRLPGSTAPVDIHLGGADAGVEEILLQLVMGVVRAAASALGAAGQAAMAALDLIGLGPNPALPALDLEQLASEGVGALRAWFTDAMDDQAQRRAWLDALGQVVGGARIGDVLTIPLGGSPVSLQLSVAAVAGPGGQLRVTPRVGLSLSALIDGVRLAAEAAVDVMTVDLATGDATPVPRADLIVRVGRDAGRLVDAGPIHIGSAELGVGYADGSPVPVVRLRDVQIGADHHDLVDLSSADAVVAAAGQIASGLIGTLIDNLGAATAVHLKTLLGLTPPAGVPPLDPAQLMVNPLGALRSWWKALLTTHAAQVPAILTHVRALLAADAALAINVEGDGTRITPWTVRLIDRVSLDAWLEGSVLVVAVTLGTRFDDIAGRCTVITVAARAELIAVDLNGGPASLLRGAELVAAFRGRGQPDARLSFGPVAIVAQQLGVAARWTAAAGFDVAFEAPGLAADLGDVQVPLALPIGADWRTSVFADVENLVGVLAAMNRAGWLGDLAALLGWSITTGAPAPHRLSLAALAADPAAELAAWGRKLVADERVIARVATALARLFTGSSGGLAGALSGRGTPTDPWILPLGTGAGAPALSLSLGPDGPRIDPTLTTDALKTWRPGMPGLPAQGLAETLFAEAIAGDDVAALARGRGGLATGLEGLVTRVVDSDALVTAPGAIAGLAIVVEPAFAWTRWPELPVERALGWDPLESTCRHASLSIL